MVTADTAPALLHATKADATRARAEAELAEAKLRDVIVQMHASGATQQSIADALHVSQPYINRIIRSARTKAGKGVRQTPLDIARLYAAGLLDRETATELLVEFDYRDAVIPNDERLDIAPHTDSADLVMAYTKGYLDPEMYESIVRTLAHK